MRVIPRLFRRFVLAQTWVCFVTMCTGFSVFGLGTLNLFFTLQANLALIAEHGAMALMEGAATQLGSLLATLALSMLGYLVFKACEQELVKRLLSDQPHNTRYENRSSSR